MKLAKLRQHRRVLATLLAVGLAGAGGAAYGEGISASMAPSIPDRTVSSASNPSDTTMSGSSVLPSPAKPDTGTSETTLKADATTPTTYGGSTTLSANSSTNGATTSVGASTTTTGPDATTSSTSTTVTNTPTGSTTTTTTNMPSTTPAANTAATDAGMAAGMGTSAGASGTSATTGATGADTPKMSASPSGTIATPMKSESADSAFSKLDASGKGFVTRDDVRGMTGFDTLFDKYNAKHDGRLTREEFAQAWAAYKAS